MRLVIQRVSWASVSIGGIVKSEIKTGLLLLLGIEDADNTEDIEWLIKKTINMRIFGDEQQLNPTRQYPYTNSLWQCCKHT